MRIPGPNENMVGKVCCCSVGRVAVVTGFGQIGDPAIEGWHGLGLDGKGTWFSTAPCVLAESADEFREKLDTRFGGKMSYNG